MEKEKNCLWRRRKIEKEKVENISTMKIIFAEEKKNGERKGGNFLEKKNTFLQGEEDPRGKRRKI